MRLVRQVVEQGLAKRKSANLKVRQPLRQLTIHSLSLSDDLARLIADELNVKQVVFKPHEKEFSAHLALNLNSDLLSEGQAREVIRAVQEARKSLGARLDQQIVVTLPELPPEPYLSHIKRHPLGADIRSGPDLSVELI